MKVTLPMMVQDQALAGISKLVEGFVVTTEPFFLDGPVTERVAILDFDEKTGALLPGTRFFPLPPTEKSGARGEYRIGETEKIQQRIAGKTVTRLDSRAFNRVSVLATILKTLALFEQELVLGRKLSWAFDGTQLLVVPRAGEWANAFYQRETHSLQFFYFAKAAPGSEPDKPEWVFTSLSRDIITHETAHAILDGIAPALYNASTPQSLAIHEAVADLTAVILAFQSHALATAVLESTNGEIDRPSAFSQIAEEFGREHSGSNALRELYTQDTMADAGQEPHHLSVVLSSALYELMMFLYREQWTLEIERLEKINAAEVAQGRPVKYADPRFSSSGRALALSSVAFARVVFGALDFMPPGELSFADVGRAIVAGQRNLIEGGLLPEEKVRNAVQRIDVLKTAFETRGMPLTLEPPLLQTDLPAALLEGIEPEDLRDSDWAAYQFAQRNRELLGIPPDTPFEVLPRLTAKKRLNSRPRVRQHQLFFKVSWTRAEPIGLEQSSLPRQRRVTAGATLVVDLSRRRPIALLRTDNDPQLAASRDALLAQLLAKDLVRFGSDAQRPDGTPRDGVIQAEITLEALKLSGVSRMLHIVHE